MKETDNGKFGIYFEIDPCFDNFYQGIVEFTAITVDSEEIRVSEQMTFHI